MKTLKTHIFILSFLVATVSLLAKRKLFEYNECKDRVGARRFTLVLIEALKTKDFNRIKPLFHPEVYFSNDPDSREASFFINKTSGNIAYKQQHFRDFLFDTNALRREQPSLTSFSEVFNESRVQDINEYDNLCHGGQLNRDEKTGKYYDTPAIQTTYQGIRYTLYPSQKGSKTYIDAMYFSRN